MLRYEPASAFTMDRLAEACGLSRATLYRRVGNRNTLLKYLADQEGVEFYDLDRPDLRTRILEATHTAIGATGSLNFTIDQVAKEAGVGVATVYRHFGDKGNLLKAFSEEFIPRQAVHDLNHETEASVEATLTQFAIETLRFIHEHRDLARLLFSADKKTIRTMSALRANQDRTLNILARYLENQIEAGQIVALAPFDLANAFMGMLLGFAFLKPTYPDFQTYQPEAVAEFVVRLFLGGARRPEHASADAHADTAKDPPKGYCG